MKHIGFILKAADAAMSDILKIVAYAIGMSLVPGINKAYLTYFSEPCRVREAACTREFPSIEISVIAQKG